jgi:hypothetical protein
MQITHFKKLREIYLKYQTLHNTISLLEKETTSLMNRRALLSQELEETRTEEKFLINKIEDALNRKVTQDDLLKIIKEDEQG